SNGVLSGDGGSIKYKANTDFYGPGSITFEVTDGSGPDDPQGLKSTLTVMTDVAPAPAKNLAPKLSGTQVSVAQLETTDTNLALLASDPEKDALTFSLPGKAPAGLKTEIDGGTLKVSADKGAPLGTQQSVTIQVSDGHNPPVRADVAVAVTSSNKPLAVTNDDAVPDAHAGRAENVPVLANDVNPFPDTPLTIVDAKLVTGPASTSVAVTGDKVKVTAPEDFTGNVVVSYTVADKTADHSRWVTGRVTLNVKGKPAAPSAPRVEEVKSKQVLLKWATPVDNGSPITGYTVSFSDGGTQACATNTCLVTGLTNNKSYTFKVSAKNAVGESAFSPASAKATPDQQPDAPGAPAIVRGDTKLDVSWGTPVGEYSPVKSFNVQISPTPAGQNPQKTGVKGTRLTWTGLTNGVAYTFRVQAVNNAPKPSDWSPYAAVAVKPAGKPFTPAAPTTTLVDTVGSQNQVRVDWKAPNLNGGELKGYTLTTYLDGAAQKSTSTTTPSATVSLPNGKGNYTFRVVVATEVAASDPSAASAPRRSVSRPGTVARPTIAPANTGAAGGRITVNFAKLAGTATGGSSAGELTYHALVSSTGADVVVVPGSTVPAPNGAATTVTIYAKSSAFANSGNASAPSNSATPYGAPGSAGVGGSNGSQGSTSFTYSWSYPGGATDTKTIQVKVGGGAWSNKAGNGSANYDTGANNKSVTVSVRAVNSRGDYGPVASKTLSSGAPKPPAPKNTVRVLRSTNNSCTQGTGQSDIFRTGPPKTCGGVRGGTSNPGGSWLSYADGYVPVGQCGSPWGGSGWYQMTGGPQDNRWVRADTVSPNPGGKTC
ncbi:MAG: fibronectin type III domain-containing protein, partial [Specibacter sp.]